MERKMRAFFSISAVSLAAALIVSMLHSCTSSVVVANQSPRVGRLDTAGQDAPLERLDTIPEPLPVRRRAPVRLDVSTPFALQYKSIAERADRGDLDAICSLVHALDYCGSRNRMRSEAQAILDTAASQPSGGLQEAALMRDLLATEAATAAADRFCQSLGEAHGPELARRIHQAAQQGDLGAMIQFALRPPLGSGIDVENADIAVRYRKEASRLLERAAMLGSRDAVRAMLIAQLQGSLVSGYGEVPVQRDADLLFAAAAVVRRFDGPELDAESELAQALGKVHTSAPSQRAVSLKVSMEQAVINRMLLDPSSVNEPIDIENASCK